MRNRKKYPANWSQLARECKERAGWCCEKCGIPHGTLKRSLWTGKVWPVYLQAAHIHHDRENDKPELAATCPSCHWRHYRRHDQIPAWYIEKVKHRQLIKQAYCI